MRNTEEQPLNIAWWVSKCAPHRLFLFSFLRSCSCVPENGETDGNGQCKAHSELTIAVHWCGMSSRVIVHILQLRNI